jgi:FtsP/CotA-like multicopper oxidase with cupredoxin domain
MACESEGPESAVKVDRFLCVTARFLSAALVLAVAQIGGFAQGSNPCPRFPVGSSIPAPEDLFSRNGILQVDFTYDTAIDPNGHTLFCFTNSDGAQSPTLHVYPGDRLRITLTNNVPLAAASSTAIGAMPGMAVSATVSSTCGSGTMTASSVNIHYHGTNTPPTCHQDDVIGTLINAGETFQYDVQFPSNEPPGLYWYHPHVHGMSEAAVQGGASGALIVEGIQNVNPVVAGLPQQVLIVRDNPVPGYPTPVGNVPVWDLSLNYVPVAYPDFTPAVIHMKPSERQFWRVLNASADTIIDLQLQYDEAPQRLDVVALDGVPTGSQDGTSRGKSMVETRIVLAPGARAEFVVTGPSSSVKNARLMTLNVDTGPDGANHPTRPLATVQTDPNASEPFLKVPQVSASPPAGRFAELDKERPTAQRKLYFLERRSDFYIAVDGQTPVLFNPDNPPAIVTTQGSVEDWVIENRSMENHEFHIHQLHFLLLEQNGVPVNNGQFLDMIQVPYWPGSGPYPSVKLRMDFRSPLIGDFLYHCHILAHEDHGMMAIVRVKPASFEGEHRPIRVPCCSANPD